MERDKLFEACQDLVIEFQELYEGWEGVAQLEGTPMRMFRMFQEYCWSPSKVEEEVAKQLRVFENGYGGMLVTGPITVWVLCPHHLLPCELKVVIGYVPDGKVLGLSKFARISVILGKRPIMQEQYSIELADLLEQKLKPQGVAVYITGRHGCMVSRGVKQEAPVVTSVIRGCFQEAQARGEFFAIARERGM